MCLLVGEVSAQMKISYKPLGLPNYFHTELLFFLPKLNKPFPTVF